ARPAPPRDRATRTPCGRSGTPPARGPDAVRSGPRRPRGRRPGPARWRGRPASTPARRAARPARGATAPRPRGARLPWRPPAAAPSPRPAAPRAGSAASDLDLFLELLGLVVGGERVQHLVHAPFEEVLETMQGELDAVVGHAPLGEVVGADLLAAVAGAHHLAAGGGAL